MNTHSIFHRFSAKFLPLIGLTCLTLAVDSAFAATLNQITDIPTADVLLARGDESPLGSAGTQQAFAFRNIDDAGTEGTRGRGNTFVIPSDVAETYEISTFAVALNTSNNGDLAGGRPEGELTLTIFEFIGTGADAIAQANEFDSDWATQFGATSGTEVFRGTFDIEAGRTFDNSELLEISFDPAELELDSNVAYGFFFIYTLDDITGLGADVSIAFDSDNTAPDLEASYGALLNTVPGASFAEAPNGQSAIRDLNFFFTGGVNGAPASPTIIASTNPIEIGDSVNLDITYDPVVTTATLETPGGALDLIALDDGVTNGDALANDGLVSLTDSPTSDHVYLVTTTAAGFADGTSDTTVFVVDPSTEVADNAFSTAIKGDGPLFYYRYEEGAGSSVLLDSSGNGHHTTDILGNITLGAGPGGMQNAANFTAGSAIAVPASSAMDAPFTVSAVLNVPNFSGSGLSNIFSMTDGTDIGRSLFFHDSTGFFTFIDGATTALTTEGLPDGVSCLVHATFDPDPDNDAATPEGEVRVFINGVEVGSPSAVNAIANNIGTWVLGSNKNLTSNSFTGWLDETAVFESELTDAQIAAHAAAFFTAADPLLGFATNLDEIDEGDSVELQWKVSDAATAVTINGTPVTGAAAGGVYTATFTPAVDTTYTIEVTSPSGTVSSNLDVTVIPSPFVPVAPVITSFTLDNATPPNITISFTGNPNTSYNLVSTPDIDGGFNTATLIGSVSTDAAGVGTFVPFIASGSKNFYRVEEQ